MSILNNLTLINKSNIGLDFSWQTKTRRQSFDRNKT